VLRRALVDGYNLLYRMEGHQVERQKGMLARERLVQELGTVLGTVAERLTVVFDGRAGVEPEAAVERGVNVVFALSADAWIEREVRTAEDPASLLVVSSDRLVRQSAEAAGAETMGCGEFLELCDRLRRTRSTRRPARTFTRRLGDAFPT